MSKKKTEAEVLPKLYVKLGDHSSIFYDVSTDTKIIGSVIVEVENTPRITAGIRGGALVKVDKEAYDSQEEAKAETAQSVADEEAAKKAQADADAKAKADADEVAKKKADEDAKAAAEAEAKKKADEEAEAKKKADEEAAKKAAESVKK